MDPLYALPSLFLLGFTSDFRFYDYYHISYSYPVLLSMFYSISLLLLSYHSMSSSCLMSLVIYLPAYTCLCSRHGFQFHDYDSVLSIHLYLSQHAIRLLYHHSPGEFYLTPLDSHVQVMELGARGFPQLLIRVAQR